MEMLDSTVISTALPAIARSMHEDPIRLNLAITSYLLSLAVFIPISGWMSDRYGARRSSAPPSSYSLSDRCYADMQYTA